MKFSRRALVAISVAITVVCAGVLVARAAMPEWIQNIEARSLVEAATFRMVPLPGGSVTIRRPPAETVPALADLIKQQPQQAELYSLKALEEEQKLDFTAAEADWKLYQQNAADKAAAQEALADFYHRRHRPADEVSALSALPNMPSAAAERFTAATEQRSWRAFERIFQVISAQALGRQVAEQQYNAWLARYPEERGLYARYFEYLLAEKDFKPASDLVARYHGKFPDDEIFPTKARALIAYKQGSVEEGLAVYDKGFQPLWPPELVKDYFDLLKETRNQRKFLEQARTALSHNPDDLNAVARIFYYCQQQGNLPAAQQAINDYRLHKDERKAQWASQELYTFATLLEDVHLYPESARYYFALYNSPDPSAPEKALAGLTRILLTAPDQQIRFGSGDLSMYKDIATMDPGPGYLNGILSLILNTSGPAYHYSEEEQRAVPYFHRSRAAELLALLDQRFPNSNARPELHARLIEAYSNYGQDQAVLRTGREFLAAFPSAPQRHRIALLMADAYARTGNSKEEFAIYDSMLQELGRKAEGVPLGENIRGVPAPAYHAAELANAARDVDEEGEESQPTTRRPQPGVRRAFQVSPPAGAAPQKGVRSPEYQEILNRYISRLVSSRQVPAALAVWRQELDRNPNDPGLYERFADFLEANRLGTEEEAVYKRAIQQFQGRNWYHKLARWYLVHKREQDLAALNEQVGKIFSGSDLEAYLRGIGMPGRLGLQFNQFAHERFPHNLRFVHNLLNYYSSPPFRNRVAWEALLRHYWFEDEDLRNRFFEYLSSTGRLEAELQPLSGKSDWNAEAKANPAGARFVAEAELWRSHFESGAPVIAAVAQQYPADFDLGRRASSVYRSLAYFDPRDTEVAVQIESNLLKAAPADRDTLARIGDIYSDREQFDKAVPYWNQMPQTEPGHAASYEDAATVFWDYYFFDDALRLLNEGRTKLGDNSLYTYQIGAIYENKRDYPRAVDEYLKGALQEGEGGQSRERLLQLARRKSTRDLVDAATGKAAVSSKYDLPALELRVAALDAEDRKSEIAVFLNNALDQTSSVEVLENIEGIARDRSLEAVRQHALERQAAISTDPLRRLELRYELVRFYEQKKDIGAAEKNVDALYRENPKILGVVRSTVDFYWRNKQQQRAIDTLLQAARDSYPALRARFNYEAARKMTEAGQHQPARKILLTLLDESPYNGEYLAAVADTFARSGDQAGLRDFYLEKIRSFQKASLPADERKNRIASLRRGLIPALTMLKDYAGAVDQYIEIINAFPDDSGLTSEAGFYAQRYGRKDQLLSYYTKTVAASPKDARWPVVLARLQTSYEDFDAAINTYTQAIRIRPDRTELLSARAALEERLLRFDAAAADYTRLYDLAYHDTKWMEKAAEIRARQNNPDLAVQALKVAFIDGRPEAPAKYLTVAERLENWNMLSQARDFAEKGMSLAGDDLLAASESHSGAQIYTRIMTRLRQHEAAYQRLQSALESAQKLPPITQQIAKNGLEAITNSELRRSQLATRTSTARSGMIACMREMGATAGRYFTPEERLSLARSLDAKNAALSRTDARDYLLPLAGNAGIPDFEVKLMVEELLSRGRLYVPSQPLEKLQVRRLKLVELGQQLERAAEVQVPGAPGSGQQYFNRAADIYRLAGRPRDELRVLESIRRSQFQQLNQPQEQRYFELLLSQSPRLLVDLASRRNQFGDKAGNFILANADAKTALSAVDARSRKEDPVWGHAYTALTGLYFGSSEPQIPQAFLAALSDRTIEERLAQKEDRSGALAGDIWFYYGSRYGEYLGDTGKGDPEDFLPAELEHTPGNGAAYFSTALYYEDSGDLTRAIADYLHVMDLEPQRIDVHNRLGGIYWKQKHNEEAVAEWKRALEMLKAQANARSIPETFWGDYAATVKNLISRNLTSQFQTDIEDILRAYVNVDGEYRLVSLLKSTFPGSNSSSDATALALKLSAGQEWRISFLQQLTNSNTGLNVDLSQIYRALLEAAQEKAQKSEGSLRQYAIEELQGIQVKWFEYLFRTKQLDRLRDELAAVPKTAWETRQAQLVPLQLKLAAQSGGLDSIIEGYRNDPEHAPSGEILRRAATDLRRSGDQQAARKILEFVFTREIESHNLTSANMLGLAEIRIESGDLPGGVSLLKRMALVVGNPFETQDPAAALLMRTGHPGEAIPFLRELVQAVPWNADYRVRLAQAEIAVGQSVEDARKDLTSVASASAVPYEIRTNAARALSGGENSDLGSKELNFVAGGHSSDASDANQPYFFAARLKAAEALPASASVPLLRAALEDNPNGGAARVPLLKAAFQAGDYHVVIAAVKPQLQSGAQEEAYSRRRTGIEDEEESLDETATETATGNEPVQGFGKIPQKEWAEISHDLGLAFLKTGDLDQALIYLRRAYKLESSAATKSQINREVQQVRATQRRRATNLARQPVIHSALEQEHVVRPRVGAISQSRKGASQ